MILVPRGSHLLVVSQAEHARQSGALAAAWRPPRELAADVWSRLHHAVERHDDGWIVEERTPLLDPRGHPLDFLRYPSDAHGRVWRRSIELAERDDPYAAVLIAEHASWLYRRSGSREAPDEAALAIFSDAAARNLESLRSSGRDEHAASITCGRRLLSTFDALSLALLGAVPVPARTERLAWGEDHETIRCERTSCGLRLGPWPFARASVVSSVEGVEVRGSRFGSPAAFREALDTGPRVTVSWRLEPSRP